MHPNDLFLHRPLFTSSEHLEHYLKPASTRTLHQLTDILFIPQDIPRLPIVLEAVCRAIEAFGTTLTRPNGMFHLVHSVVNDLRADVKNTLNWTTSSDELSHPLLRRLLPHAPYAVFLSAGMLPNDQASRYWTGLGAEIASCLATGKAFSRNFANDLRREITPRLFGNSSSTPTSAPWEKSAAKKLRLAAKLFESDGSTDPSDKSSLQLFDLKAGYELSRKLRYSPPRQRQALLDRHHQSEWQFQASATQILARAEAGDHTSLLTLIAFLTGISLATTRDLPICTVLDSNESIMGLNLDDGTIMTNIGRLTPSSAKPTENAQAFRDATWIMVKPMPVVVVELLRRLAEERPDASTLADLLPQASTSGRQLTLDDDHAALKATTARFLASAGSVAVGLGIDRLYAALLTNDFAIIPGSKLYYALSRREPVWEAANRLFSHLGWGPAVPFVPGLPIGSHIVPQRQAITDWLMWMAEEVKHKTPGRHSSIAQLVAHHNAFARFCASVTVWLLAAREVKEFPFTTYTLDPSASFACLIDKWVGAFPGELWMPLCAPLRAQLALWLTHCQAFDRRLKKQGLPPEHPLMSMLERFNGGKSVPMFFSVDIGTYRPHPLGSADLTRWWPESHRFSPDFGRHFWETELREADVSSSRIDLLMRHITQSVEGHCSTHGDTLSQAASDITTAQTELLKQLGFCPISGLTSRQKESS